MGGDAEPAGGAARAAARRQQQQQQQQQRVAQHPRSPDSTLAQVEKWDMAATLERLASKSTPPTIPRAAGCERKREREQLAVG